MRILLAQITSVQIDKYPTNCYPLGLMSIAKFLSARMAGIEVKIIVGDIGCKDIESYKPDIVGISLLTGFFTMGCAMASAIRQRYPELPIVFGGHHITYLPDNLPGSVSVGVLGEGERTFLQLCTAFEKSGRFGADDLSKIAGIVYWDKGKLQQNPRGETFLKPEEIPIIDNYDACSFKIKRRSTFHIIASRGCPHKCRFCSSSPFWGKVRLHSPQSVAGQIEYIQRRFDPEVIFVFDDLFIANRKHLSEIRDLMIAKKLHRRASFSCWVAANIFTQDVIDMLKEMNFFAVNIAVESAVPRVYEYLKGTWNTPADNKRAIELAHKNGLLVYSSAIVGAPGETEADIESTCDFLRSLPISGGTAGILKPLPGTALWEEAKQRHLVTDTPDDWATFDSENVLDPAVPIMSDCLDRATLKKHLDRITTLLITRERNQRWRTRLMRINTPGKAARFLHRKLRAAMQIKHS